MSASKSRRADLHYRLDIRPGVPMAEEVVELCQRALIRKFPDVLPRAYDPGLSLRPGWIAPFYMAIESLHAALSAEQKGIWFPLELYGAGWRLRVAEHVKKSDKELLPKPLSGIFRQYRARVLNTCSSCGGTGQFYPQRDGLLMDVLCRKCAAPRRLMQGLSQLCDPVWDESGDLLKLVRTKLPSPWRQALLRWSIGSGISPQSITPAIYMEWIKALLPAAQAIAERGKQHYHHVIHEEMDVILSRLSEYEYA